MPNSSASHLLSNQSGTALEADDLINKAYSLSEIGYTEEALEAYDRALTIEPNNAWTLARKARTLRLMGRHEDAIDTVNHALELDPKFGWAWLVKGQIQERQGKLESALASHETAAEIMPDDVWVWYNQAAALSSLGQHQAAWICSPAPCPSTPPGITVGQTRPDFALHQPPPGSPERL